MDDPIVRAELADAPLTAVLADAKAPGFQVSLGFLLLWMTGTAVTLVAIGSQINMVTCLGVMQFPVKGDFLKVYALVTRLLVAPLMGFSIAYSASAIWRRLKEGQLQPPQPGHWLLYQFAAWLLAGAFVNRIAAFLLPSFDFQTAEGLNNIFTLRMWTEVVPAVACGFVSAWACLRLHGPRHWRIFFGSHAALAGLLMLAATARTIPLSAEDAIEFAKRATNLALLVTLVEGALLLINRIACLVSVFRDLSSHRELGRAHWAGVGTLVLYVGLVLADSVATSLERYFD